MDFHPECLIAERGGGGLFLNGLLGLTHFWRRRVDKFEVLGLDQARRLSDSGVDAQRIRLQPNFSPVTFGSGLIPRPLPTEFRGGAGVILYSGNWGVAHDERTFIEGYSKYVSQSKRALHFWLNATGIRADHVERELRSRSVPFYRSHLVPLEELPQLLIAADVHLITLRDAFVGYVVPSKIHACIASGRRIIFVGSPNSDVHRLASSALSEGRYRRVDVDDINGLVEVLRDFENATRLERKRDNQRPDRNVENYGALQAPRMTAPFG
jgi:hypothetical protein